ncbi:dynamin family protein [Helicobacter cetorum]|uniref:dynamin family protein n=1 Tax=Helicobacter cetorum TaxID=138563 RepID=UPI000CF1B8C0|nr:dynamin family protein [Helicobacter cetorum]
MNHLTKKHLIEKIESLESYFAKYNEQSNKQDFLKKLENLKEELSDLNYKIAVVANMSGGKSTFINTLFGDDVLPTSSCATTDCATYIYSSEEKQAIIYFSDKEKQIIKNLEELKEYAKKDIDCKEEKYKNVEKIELFYPFKNLKTSLDNEIKIILIDTPGPNSTGGSYAQKHKDQTRIVLNDAHLALFVFDYSQLDANLSSDEQGLWHTIKARKHNDRDFEVYFLINKIDMAIDDNAKDIKTLDELRTKWYEAENKAISKIQQASLEHGIEEPKVYAISSEYELLCRNTQNYLGTSKLQIFQSHFKNLFEDSWEEKFKEYLGVERLEKDINSHIQNEVKLKRLSSINHKISRIIEEEINALSMQEEVLKKPQDEAKKKLREAQSFLEHGVVNLETLLKDSMDKIEQKSIKAVFHVISEAISEQFSNKIEETAKKAIAYFEGRFCQNLGPSSIEKFICDNFENYNLKEKRITLKGFNNTITESEMKDMLEKYSLKLFANYKNNYLDVKSCLKDIFIRIEEMMSKELESAIRELNSDLTQTLEIKLQPIELEEKAQNLFFEAKMPESVLRYEGDWTWYNPLSWLPFGNSKEKVSLTISPKEVLKSIQKGMQKFVDEFEKKEKEGYKKAIKELNLGSLKTFMDYKKRRYVEMSELSKQIDKNEKLLEEIGKQKQDFFKKSQVGE